MTMETPPDRPMPEPVPPMKAPSTPMKAPPVSYEEYIMHRQCGKDPPPFKPPMKAPSIVSKAPPVSYDEWLRIQEQGKAPSPPAGSQPSLAAVPGKLPPATKAASPCLGCTDLPAGFQLSSSTVCKPMDAELSPCSTGKMQPEDVYLHKSFKSKQQARFENHRQQLLLLKNQARAEHSVPGNVPPICHTETCPRRTIRCNGCGEKCHRGG